MGSSGRAITLHSQHHEYSRVKRLAKICNSQKKTIITKRRTVAADRVAKAVKFIEAAAEDIEIIGDEETQDRELRRAEMLLVKAENMDKHRDAIRSRPEKSWVLTKDEKKKRNTADRKEKEERGKAGREKWERKEAIADEQRRKDGVVMKDGTVREKTLRDLPREERVNKIESRRLKKHRMDREARAQFAQAAFKAKGRFKKKEKANDGLGVEVAEKKKKKKKKGVKKRGGKGGK